MTKFWQQTNTIPDSHKFYTDKKLCIIGCGHSTDSYHIRYDNYDYIVSMNRIFLTKYWSKIDIYYNSMGRESWNMFPELAKILSENQNLKQIFFSTHGCSKKAKQFMAQNIYKNDLKNWMYTCAINKQLGRQYSFEKYPLTGNCILFHILHFYPKSIDLFGYDFYNGKIYVEGIPEPNIPRPEMMSLQSKFHQIEENLNFLEQKISEYPTIINWHK